MSERICPHCKGSLERYEDPVAVRLIAELEAENQRNFDEKVRAVQREHKLQELYESCLRTTSLYRTENKRLANLLGQLRATYAENVSVQYGDDEVFANLIAQVDEALLATDKGEG